MERGGGEERERRAAREAGEMSEIGRDAEWKGVGLGEDGGMQREGGGEEDR